MSFSLDQKSLEALRQLNSSGYFKRCYQQLNELRPLVNKMIEEPEKTELLIQYFLLLGTVALRLSILTVARSSVLSSFNLLRRFNTDEEKKFHHVILESGLILQKIEYWLCRYGQSVEINQTLLNYCDKYMPGQLNEKLEVMTQLGNTHRAWCRYDQAGAIIESAYESYKTNKNTLNPIVASNILFVIARYSMDTDNSNFGVDLATECLRIREDYYKDTNPEHIDISLVHELLAKLHFSIGQTDKAETYHNLAYENKIRVFGEYNFESIDSINERGRILLSKKKQEEAKHYFKQLGEVSLQLLGPRNQYEALSYNNLGCSFYNEGKHEESIANHLKALQLYEKLCGINHYKLIFALNQMAYAHKNLGRHKVAVQLWKRCIEILRQVVGPPTEKNIKTMTDQINSLSVQFEE